MAFEEMNDKKYKEMILEQEEFEYELMVMEMEGKPTEVYESYDGELIEFRGNERNIRIPHYITSIRDRVFLGYHNLESVKFGKNVEYIGAECFVNCENLHSVTIPENVKYIFPKAFGYSVTESQPYKGYGFYSSYYIRREFTKNYRFTIRGKRGTAAERYAKENGLIFEEIGENE